MTMNSIRRAVLSVICVGIAGTAAVEGKDQMRVAAESKVESGKGRLREKSATDWLTLEELRALNDKKEGEKQQLIYFEYHGGRAKWRAVYTDKVMFSGYYWWVAGGENEMEAKLNEQMAAGLQPAFITRSGNWYAMLFVTPDQFVEARKVLDELGIGAPKLKK
jgi:hypothetical protein